MNKRLKPTAQGGFTLIELIVVIVILGILAATALPKFSSLGGDARVATLNAARGSLNSVVAMAHGRALATAATTGTLSFEGTSVTLVNGYPKADTNTLLAAGLDVTNHADFTQVPAGNTTATAGPNLTTGETAVIPTAVAGTANAANCFVKYTEATSTTSPPTVTVTATADNCN